MRIEGSRFAYIADLHGGDPSKIITKLKKKPVDLIILAGDIPDYTARNLTSITKKFLKLKVPVILFAGSHENSELYKKATQNISDKLFIDAMKLSKRIINFSTYDLIIIPGSDSVSSGPRPFVGGNYYLFPKRDPKRLRWATKRLKDSMFARKTAPVYIEDVTNAYKKKRKAKPSNRILISHIPKRCKTTRGTDVAHFGRAKRSFEITASHSKELEEPELIVEGSVFMLKTAQKLKKKGYPVQILKKNVGSEMINKFMKKQKITKMISGHIHEAGKRAINNKEKTIKPKTPAKDITISSPPHRATIITCHKEGISYEFL